MHAGRSVLLALGLLLSVGIAAAAAPVVTRGPYLQLGTDDVLTFRWRTSTAVDSAVRIGPAPGQLAPKAAVPGTRTEHVVKVSGLLPDTLYYYAVGTASQVLAGDDAQHFFRTAPAPGARKPLRIWVIGDSGTAGTSPAAVRDAYVAATGGEPANLWLMLGDNAYDDGTDADYQDAVFEMFPAQLRTSVLWPTLGNHDASSTDSSTESGPYFDIFSLPRQAEAGGVASGTESYYSFDYANVHFIGLNSAEEELTVGAPMLEWLSDDLAATEQDWVIAFWHHPPYSKGSHDSDDASDSGGRMTAMRTNVLPILEQGGVDLVLAGHSHSYERSFLLDGHYGISSTLIPDMLVDAGDGRIGGTGAYQKPSQGPAAHEGAVYTVLGSSAQKDWGELDHPAMYKSLQVLGSLILEIEGDHLDGTFLDSQGVVRDYFTLVKHTAVPPTADFEALPKVGVAPLTVKLHDLSSTNAAAWAWDLDNDGDDDSFVQEPSIVLANPGQYSVTVELTCTNAAGSDSATKTESICVAPTAVPPIGGLIFGADKVTVSWPAVPGAQGYDSLRGTFGALQAADGYFAARDLCCTHPSQNTFKDYAKPASGSAFFYLVRALGLCGVAGTYDETGAGQIATRDPGIEAGGECAEGACSFCPSGTDPDLDGVCRIDTVAVQEGSVMLYLANKTNPGVGLTWKNESFVPGSAWKAGSYGVGYDQPSSPNALALIKTAVSSGTSSIYTRAKFVGAETMKAVAVAADYDDGYIVWLNGSEIYRSPQMPSGDPAWNTGANSHESSNAQDPVYGPLHDVSTKALGPLHDGQNVLAVGIWNTDSGSSDLVVVPQLTLTVSLDNCPNKPNPDQKDTDGDGVGDACE